MKITQDILDDLTAKAKASPRLRMNLDLRDSAEDTSQRMLTECKSAYQQYFPRGRVDKEFSCQGILDYCWRRKELSDTTGTGTCFVKYKLSRKHFYLRLNFFISFLKSLGG